MFGYEMSDYDRKVYEEQLKDFLPDKMIDCHIHIWPKECKKNSDAKACASWTGMVAEYNTVEDLFQTYKDMFPGKTVKAVLMGEPQCDLTKNNKYASDAAKKYNLPAFYCTHHSMSAEFLEKEVEEGGFCGLKPYQNNSPDYIPAKEIRIFDFLTPEHLELANKKGWIVMLHISRPARLRDPLNLAQLLEIEEKYPNVKLIVAHVGRAYTPEDLGDAFEVLKNTKNMMFDFTANTYDYAMIKCLETVGPKRFMFGSDLPILKMRMFRTFENGIYYNNVPRGLYGDVSGDIHMRETDQKDITCFMYEELLAFKRAAQTLKLSKQDVEDIMCNNAAKLFNISF